MRPLCGIQHGGNHKKRLRFYVSFPGQRPKRSLSKG